MNVNRHQSGYVLVKAPEKMSLNAKDAMIDQYGEEEEYNQYLDWLDQQQEWLARLVEQGYLPTTKETHHAEV